MGRSHRHTGAPAAQSRPANLRPEIQGSPAPPEPRKLVLAHPHAKFSAAGVPKATETPACAQGAASGSAHQARRACGLPSRRALRSGSAARRRSAERCGAPPCLRRSGLRFAEALLLAFGGGSARRCAPAPPHVLVAHGAPGPAARAPPSRARRKKRAALRAGVSRGGFGGWCATGAPKRRLVRSSPAARAVAARSRTIRAPLRLRAPGGAPIQSRAGARRARHRAASRSSRGARAAWPPARRAPFGRAGRAALRASKPAPRTKATAKATATATAKAKARAHPLAFEGHTLVKGAARGCATPRDEAALRP